MILLSLHRHGDTLGSPAAGHGMRTAVVPPSYGMKGPPPAALALLPLSCPHS